MSKVCGRRRVIVVVVVFQGQWEDMGGQPDSKLELATVGWLFWLCG